MINKPVLSIIIVSYNTALLTNKCLSSIKADKKLQLLPKDEGDELTIPTEVIVVDNNSSDNSVKLISGKNPWVKLIKNKENKGFGGANNQGMAIAKGNYILFLNSDTVVLHGAISQALDWLSSHPEAGSCSGQLLNPNKTIQASGGYFPNPVNIFTWVSGLDDLPGINSIIKPIHPHTPEFYTKDSFFLKDHKQDWLTGAFLLTREELVRKVGGFDEKYFMYGEELELMYRMKLSNPKYESWYLVGPQIIHYGGASAKKKSDPLVKEIKGMELFFKKHKPGWQYRLVKWMLSFNPSIRLRGWFYRLKGDREKSAYYQEICSQI